MRHRVLSLFCLFLTCLASTSYAYSSNAGRWYQFEMIVFSHITAEGLEAEQWSAVNAWQLPQGQMLSLKSAPGETTFPPYTLLPTRYFMLKREAAKIAKQPHYKVLMHVAWRQQVQNPRNAIPIRIHGGALYSNSGRPMGNGSIWQVNGSLKISVLRYLDMNFNLVFASPTDSLSKAFRDGSMLNVAGKFAYFPFSQSRRMRSKELNYIDHPLYGVLIEAFPLKG